MALITMLACRGGREAEKTYPCPAKRWCLITKEDPQANPPTDPSENSIDPTIMSTFLRWGVQIKYTQFYHRCQIVIETCSNSNSQSDLEIRKN